MLDISLMRLQYEILNTSLAQLAQESSIPFKMLEREAEQGRWKQLWPEQPPIAISLDDDDSTTDLDPFVSETDAYIENNRRRLKAYSLAKEILLAQKYLELEVALVDKATDLISTVDKAADIKALSALYKDLTSGSNLTNLAAATLGTDESGIPTLILRDLSGKA